MSLSDKRRHIYTASSDAGEVYVVAGTARREIPTERTLASAAEIIAAAERRGDEIVADAQQRADAIAADTDAAMADVREAARQEALQAVESEFKELMEIVRAAAREAKSVHDDIVSEAALTIARATTIAVQRMVADYYEADPGRTAAVCAEAVRAAAGQRILRVRVHEAALQSVQASLVHDGVPAVSDSSVTIGGCIVDLEAGTIDATLESRLDLLDVALADDAGAAA